MYKRQDDDDATDDDDAAGGPVVLSTCGAVGNGSMPTMGQAVTDNDSSEPLFDIYNIMAQAGDCIWIKGDNGPEGADMLAYIADAGGNYYGLRQDFSQLDDEWGCTTPNAAGFGCPEASVEIMVSGQVMIGIGMWFGDTMTSSNYTLNIARNGNDINPGAPVQSGVPIQ